MEYSVGAWYFSYSPDQALIEVVPMLATRVTVLMILSNLMIWSLGACWCLWHFKPPVPLSPSIIFNPHVKILSTSDKFVVKIRKFHHPSTTIGILPSKNSIKPPSGASSWYLKGFLTGQNPGSSETPTTREVLTRTWLLWYAKGILGTQFSGPI